MSEQEPSETAEPTKHHVGPVSDLDVGENLLVEINGVELAIYHTKNGFFAMSNYCVHQGGPMCEGPVTGTVSQDSSGELTYDSDQEVVKCPWHGWEFDIESGEHLSRPQYNQPTYEVEQRDGELYVVW
jgi:nitrite reductase (NADH) small subunit